MPPRNAAGQGAQAESDGQPRERGDAHDLPCQQTDRHAEGDGVGDRGNEIDPGESHPGVGQGEDGDDHERGPGVQGIFDAIEGGDRLPGDRGQRQGVEVDPLGRLRCNRVEVIAGEEAGCPVVVLAVLVHGGRRRYQGDGHPGQGGVNPGFEEQEPDGYPQRYIEHQGSDMHPLRQVHQPENRGGD